MNSYKTAPFTQITLNYPICFLHRYNVSEFIRIFYINNFKIHETNGCNNTFLNMFVCLSQITLIWCTKYHSNCFLKDLLCYNLYEFLIFLTIVQNLQHEHFWNVFVTLNFTFWLKKTINEHKYRYTVIEI